jgi:chromosome segregation ATPase
MDAAQDAPACDFANNTEATFSQDASLDAALETSAYGFTTNALGVAQAGAIEAVAQKKKTKRARNTEASCQVCERKFDSAGARKRHMLSHPKAKPFKCTVCDKTFTRKVNMKARVNAVYKKITEHVAQIKRTDREIAELHSQAESAAREADLASSRADLAEASLADEAAARVAAVAKGASKDRKIERRERKIEGLKRRARLAIAAGDAATRWADSVHVELTEIRAKIVTAETATRRAETLLAEERTANFEAALGRASCS